MILVRAHQSGANGDSFDKWNFINIVHSTGQNMAPKRSVSKPKSDKPSVGARKSKRLSNTNSIRSGHLREAAVSSGEMPTECEIPLLNDDCLLHIFAYLPLKDLLQNVGVCSRHFNALAIEAARKKYRPERFVFYFPDKRSASIPRRFSESIEVYDRAPNSIHSFSWLKDCVSLKSLTIRNMMIDYDVDCARTLEKLENLTLICCDTPKDESFELGLFVLACKNLKSITISMTLWRVFSELLANVTNLENIERICIDNWTRDPIAAEITAKIANMKKLKCLTFCVQTDRDVRFIDALCGSKSLEKLDLCVRLRPSNTAEDLTVALDKFQNLKSCEIKYQWVWRKCPTGVICPAVEQYTAAKLRERLRNFDVVESGSIDARLVEDMYWGTNGPYISKNYKVTLTRKS